MGEKLDVSFSYCSPSTLEKVRFWRKGERTLNALKSWPAATLLFATSSICWLIQRKKSMNFYVGACS